MSGQAIVTVSGKVWTCAYANLPSEILLGLSGKEYMAPGVGMLFDMGANQSEILLYTDEMLFSMDVLFISEAGTVVAVFQDIEPGEIADFLMTDGGARYFMEVNAGELYGIELGSTVTIQLSGFTGINLTEILALMMIAGMGGIIMKSTFGEK